MTKPTFPLICICSDGSLDLITGENLLSKVSTLALINSTFFDNAILHDKYGNQWTYIPVVDNFKNTWLTKLLARTFYNPSYDAKTVWTLKGSYDLSDLKQQLNYCVDKDDDIITQFAEAEVIKSAIDNSSSFDNVLQVLNKYVFSVDEQQLWKEQDGSV